MKGLALGLSALLCTTGATPLESTSFAAGWTCAYVPPFSPTPIIERYAVRGNQLVWLNEPFRRLFPEAMAPETTFSILTDDKRGLVAVEIRPADHVGINSVMVDRKSGDYRELNVDSNATELDVHGHCEYEPDVR